MQYVRVTVDLSAIRHNLRQARSILGPGVGITGVVKSDAYGHGLVPVAKALEEEMIDFLGVAYLEEGILLRSAGIKSPILIMCGLNGSEECREAIAHDLTPVLFDPGSIRTLSLEAAKLGRVVPLQLKVDTGMGRLGVLPRDVKPLLEEIRQSPTLNLQAIMSHLSSADEPDDEFTLFQLSRFKEVMVVAEAMKLRLPFSSIANSAGLLLHTKTHMAMVRPGIMLYGYVPGSESRVKPVLRPAMRFCGRVIQIKVLESGSPVSYGRTHYTSGSTMVAIASGGYGEGLLRSMSNKAFALIRGKKVPVIGTICMNMTICDITALTELPAVGDEVVFLGTQGAESINAQNLAAWSDTIPYEIICSIGQRHHREYTT